MLRGGLISRPVRRCRLVSSKPQKSGEPAKKKETPLTREEVEALAEKARTEQRIWDAERKLFGGGISLGHPFFFVLLGSAIMLHYANGRKATEIEQNEEHLERLKRRVTARPLSPSEIDDVIAHKKRQMDLWRAKVHDTDPKTSEDAKARLLKLENDIAELDIKR